MPRKVLTGAAAMEIKRLYGLTDVRGNRIHSQMEIAQMLDVSETTVFRVIHKGGAYSKVRELPTEDEATASRERFMREHPEYFQDAAKDTLVAARAEIESAPQRLDAEISALRREPPPMLLDGGEPGESQEEPRGLTELQKRAAAYGVADSLLGELKNEQE